MRARVDPCDTGWGSFLVVVSGAGGFCPVGDSIAVPPPGRLDPVEISVNASTSTRNVERSPSLVYALRMLGMPPDRQCQDRGGSIADASRNSPKPHTLYVLLSRHRQQLWRYTRSRRSTAGEWRKKDQAQSKEPTVITRWRANVLGARGRGRHDPKNLPFFFLEPMVFQQMSY